MTRFSLAFAVLAFGLAACAPQQPKIPFERIATKDAYLALVAGKEVHGESGFAVSSPDGTLTGTFAGGFTGSWEWQDEFWCRTITAPPSIAGSDCQLLEISGDQVRVTRDRGEGDTIVLTIKDRST
ncbi:MAG: hypothetical protein AAGB15_09955 [Pseudomonadota bacterium]